MTLVLMDARNSLFRYGARHLVLRSGKGVATGALYGILSSLVQFKRRYKDARFVMVWDGGRGWRQVYYPEYKGNRGEGEPKPEIKLILGQEKLVRDVVTMLGVPQIRIQDVEADDIISVLARKFIDKHRVMVCSSDKDFYQLMQYGVEIVAHGTLPITEAICKQRFGVSSTKVLKLRVLIGDGSDNISNVLRGIGPVTAVKMIEAGIDPCAATWEDGGRHPKLENVWDKCLRNRELMTLPSVIGHLYKPSVRNGARRAIVTVKQVLQGNGPVSESMVTLLDTFMELDMRDAVEFRHILASLQK